MSEPLAPNCPECGVTTRNWLAKALAILHMDVDTSRLDDTLFPVVAIQCTNCGYSRFFAASTVLIRTLSGERTY